MEASQYINVLGGFDVKKDSARVLGSGTGAGLGPGSGRPVLIYSVELEFSEEARKAKVVWSTCGPMPKEGPAM